MSIIKKKCLFFLPSQLYPSPVYPSLQVQLNDPLVLLHTAFSLQLCVDDAHSLTSEIQFKTVMTIQENKGRIEEQWAMSSLSFRSEIVER